ncbi:MAG: ArsB/NhaD family transporter [Candidatus Atabeyarchaeum deiterrae]
MAIEIQLVAIIIFLFTFALIVTGGHARPIAGLIGAFLMLTAGVFTSVEDALSYVHIETLVVLFGIMVLVGVLREGHFFRYIGAFVVGRVGLNPTRIFYVFIVLTAFLSAFLDSVAVVLFMVAITIELCHEMEIDPKPFIIAEILAANIGGTATSIGDPPNIMISLTYGISFPQFIASMGPLTIIALTVFFLYINRRYRKGLLVKRVRIKKLPTKPAELIEDRKTFLLGASMFITFLILMTVSSSLGITPAMISLGIAATLLFLGGKRLVPILENVDWSTLLFFGSIFIVVGGLTKTGVIASLAVAFSGIVGGNLLLAIFVVTWVCAFGSAFVGNIPFAVTMLPLVQGIASATGLPLFPLLWSLVLGCDIGGNATMIGTAAGLVASDLAEKSGHRIGHKEFFRVGLTSVLLTVGIGTIYLAITYGLAPI